MHVDKACHILAYQKQRKDSLIVMDVTCKHYPKLIYFCICNSQVCTVLFYAALSHVLDLYHSDSFQVPFMEKASFC